MFERAHRHVRHTHPNSYGAPGSIPGPGDNGPTLSSDRGVAFMMTSSHVCMIEAMANGSYRVQVSDGNPLTPYQKGELIKNMQLWEEGKAADPCKWSCPFPEH